MVTSEQSRNIYKEKRSFLNLYAKGDESLSKIKQNSTLINLNTLINQIKYTNIHFYLNLSTLRHNIIPRFFFRY